LGKKPGSGTNTGQGVKRRVLFLCTTNSCRSQMAEGLLQESAGDKFEAYSAGAVVSSVHPMAERVMGEIGIDLSGQRSKSVKEYLTERFDYVITVCGEHPEKLCPLFPGEAKQRLHWSFTDPAEAVGNEEERLAVFRQVRDKIKATVEKFVQESREFRR
jgi:arsenate reductase